MRSQAPTQSRSSSTRVIPPPQRNCTTWKRPRPALPCSSLSHAPIPKAILTLLNPSYGSPALARPSAMRAKSRGSLYGKTRALVERETRVDLEQLGPRRARVLDAPEMAVAGCEHHAA